MPVHPRPRGEHSNTRQIRLSIHGSSPPARGTRSSASREHRCQRFIPARAGNTPVNTTGSIHTTVHPRPRGEHEIQMFGGRTCHRFIPARAGNTLGSLSATGY